VVQQGELKEIHIALDPNSPTGFKEIYGELSDPALADYFENLGVAIADFPEGFQTEVNLQMLDWLKLLESKLNTGYILSIDYGYPAAKYYHPQRSQGTLQAYFKHRHHSNFYANLGQQDLTAHVDFTSLQNFGESLGLKTLGLTQQGLFLMALGLGDRLNELATNPRDVMSVLSRRDALHQLIDPMGLGKFYVLLQGKNLTEQQLQSPPKGFAHPV
jgi:SAM-dependent MidA family methyltransferase